MHLENHLIHTGKLLNAFLIILTLLTFNSCYAFREVSNKHRIEREQKMTRKTDLKSLQDSLISQGQIQKGFTKQQVIAAYGKPYKKNPPQRIPYRFSFHFIEQWVYLDRQQYVYFIDGKIDCVRDMQVRTKRKRNATSKG